jgi:cytochrome c oxidase subunit 4
MSAHEHTSHDHGHASHDHAAHDHSKLYAGVLGALLVLTAITVGASYIDFGSANIVIAVLIASVKASLVALFFMHLRWDKGVNAIIMLVGFFFLGLLLVFCLLDIDNRLSDSPSGKAKFTPQGAPSMGSLQTTTDVKPEVKKDAAPKAVH